MRNWWKSIDPSTGVCINISYVNFRIWSYRDVWESGDVLTFRIRRKSSGKHENWVLVETTAPEYKTTAVLSDIFHQTLSFYNRFLWKSGTGPYIGDGIAKREQNTEVIDCYYNIKSTLFRCHCVAVASTLDQSSKLFGVRSGLILIGSIDPKWLKLSFLQKVKVTTL